MVASTYHYINWMRKTPFTTGGNEGCWTPFIIFYRTQTALIMATT